jgi:hypothetical protein
MNKLDNETWEDYAFRNELFIIVYDENDKSIIRDVIIPIHDKIIYNDTSDRYTTLIDKLLSIIPKILPETEEYFKKRVRLYDLKRFWTVEEKKIMPINRLKMYNRYKELKTKISETHKDELDELLNIKSGGHPPDGTPDYDDWLHGHKYNCSERFKNDAKKRIEMYNIYMKNKEIYRQINEMEEKIKQLKSDII